ncbi:MAG: FHA domain-containing protein [Candidatus Sumerlaeota bacterium]
MQKNARLVVEGRDNWVFSHSIGDADRVTIGRSSENDVALGDSHSSKRHAEIIRRNDQYYLHDLGSRNGTVLNDKKISEAPLKDGDIIRIGQAMMSFLAEEDKTLDESCTRVNVGAVSSQAGRMLDPVANSVQELRSSIQEMKAGSDGTEQVEERLGSLEKELEAAQDTIRRLTVVNTFMGVLASHPGNASSALQAALDFIAEQVDADNAFIMLIDGPNKKWAVRARYGDIDDWRLHHADETEAPLSLSLVEKTVKKAEPIVYRREEDSKQTEDFAEARSIVALGIKAGMCFPLKRNGKVLGVVYCDYRKPYKKLRSEDRVLCEMLSEQIARALLG